MPPQKKTSVIKLMTQCINADKTTVSAKGNVIDNAETIMVPAPKPDKTATRLAQKLIIAVNIILFMNNNHSICPYNAPIFLPS